MSQWFAVLLIAGLMLIGAEVFIPGGVLGVVGAIALLTAAMIGFAIFPPSLAALIAVSMLVMVGLVIWLWVRIFPRTGIGRQMTALRDLKDARGTDDRLQDLIGKTGVTRSALRPSGYVELDHRRVDVVTAGDMIEAGVAVRVVAVEGNRVVVEALPSAESEPA